MKVLVVDSNTGKYTPVERTPAEVYGLATAALSDWVEATDNRARASSAHQAAVEELSDMELSLKDIRIDSAEDLEYWNERISAAHDAVHRLQNDRQRFENLQDISRQRLGYCVDTLPGAVWTFYLVDDEGAGGDGQTRAYDVTRMLGSGDNKHHISIKVRDLTAMERQNLNL